MPGLFTQFFPPKSKWTIDDIPDLSGKVMLITGGNTGIGKETARVLLSRNAKVYVACRSPQKAEEAVRDLKEKTGKSDLNIAIVEIDLSDLASVKKGAEDFLARESRLDVLFNSAGVMWPPKEQMDKHGRDLQFGTNVLGHYYLTTLLLPLLLDTAKSNGEGHARVVNTSSLGHQFSKSAKQGGPVNLASVYDGPEREKLNTRDLYFQSKSGNVLFAQELARRYGSQGIVSTSLNPGNIHTDLTRHVEESAFQELAKKLVLYPVSMGALTQLYAGASVEGKDFNGKYLIPWARIATPRSDHDSLELQTALWEWCEKEVAQHTT